MSVTLNLEDRLSHIHSATFQLHMDYRHTVDKQHHITSTITSQWVRSLETRLTYNLITALTSTYLLCIKDFQIYLLATVICICWIITLYYNLSTIDKTVHLKW